MPCTTQTVYRVRHSRNRQCLNQANETLARPVGISQIQPEAIGFSPSPALRGRSLAHLLFRLRPAHLEWARPDEDAADETPRTHEVSSQAALVPHPHLGAIRYRCH